MKITLLGVLVSLSLLVTGCVETRSISNSSDRPEGTRSTHASAIGYRGELSEFDVLGVAREMERERAVTRGSSVLLIQSGAMFPDGSMVSELGLHFKIVPFSGVPTENKGRRSTNRNEVVDFAKSLRLAAARGANETIVCYWGILESAREELATKTVSWVPVVSWITPDERQHMRIRLKLAVIDVRTGNWTMLSPEPFDDKTILTHHQRSRADQGLVERLKQKSDEAAVREVVRAMR